MKKLLAKFNLNQENKCLDHYLSDIDNLFLSNNRQLKTSIKIWLPKIGKTALSKLAASQFEIKNTYYYHLINIIQGTLSDLIMQKSYMTSFEQFQIIDNGKCEQVYSKIYFLDVMLKAYKEVYILLHEPGNNLKYIVVLLLAQYGSIYLTSPKDALLWPIYILFRN